VPERSLPWSRVSTVALVCLLALPAAGGEACGSSTQGVGAGIDGSVPAPCNSATCPAGCCDPVAGCEPGTDANQCGNGGEWCVSCTVLGFQSCDPTQHACASVLTTCSAAACPGCCIGTSCFEGSDPNQCGAGGSACQACASEGQVCTKGACVAPPACNPSTCSGCCDANGDCQPGNTDDVCGAGAIACESCSAVGGTCQDQRCPCNAGNCEGCCDATGVCRDGFLDTQCGGGGAACADCTTLDPAQTCNDALDEPVCVSSPSTLACVVAYAGCPAGTTTPVPSFAQDVCSSDELANAAEACELGPSTIACDNFFAYEHTQSPACAACLQPFDGDPSDPSSGAMAACTAPFMSAMCNEATACSVDCIQQSCASCPSDPDQPIQSTCPDAVIQHAPTQGQCFGYYMAAGDCIGPATDGSNQAAVFCDLGGPVLPYTYGDWLQTVGTHYCGAPAADAGTAGD
jgi:hypothetical protein